MVKVWMVRTDPKAAAGVIKIIMDREGKLPPDLVKAYQMIVAGATPGLVATFFSELGKKCPEALHYFQEDTCPPAG